jgi:hypothetical protein
MFVSKPIMRFLSTLGILIGASGHLMAQAADAAEDIRGPKPLVAIPQPAKFPFAFWAGVAGGVLLILIAVFLWRKFACGKLLKSPPEIALASLSELEKTRDQLAAEVFANQAAGTVRQYIADRFGLAAPRRTTEEFFRDLERNGTAPVIAGSDHLKAFLKSCDLAKFAGANLDAARRGELLQAARGFVTSTAANTNSKVVTP